ncbi:YhcN/YlaJ family sporulation lipoprotein [Aquibacillus koreensis]|uniref:YhcN/YlaJ family sporulation lipoprotein n=1 Tax=Aquibacillus koreensis TaxID=279446 RepID=A0A9X4AID5_9BACI|nr:YhcN/YlaJ family sporulation lipoprotein [Aquibacillus koreensis]MCT2538101.1 YhcN/YlaJ family sporulation lipoprotein [Aquibacillus koreensis]MDC3420624.1 YhcN/YlaJ family sporulation lipoprotein [Aquibacillus koreensis]
MSKQFLALFFVSTLFLFGCQQQEDEKLANQGETENQYIHVKNSDPVEYEELSNQEIAKHLANLASEVPNVNQANAVVAGPYAAVAIDVDKDLDRSRVGTIKYAVTEALQHDPYGKTAIVVADADGTERIKDMANKVQQGHPVQGIVDELAAIVGRYMPEFPINQDQPTDPDQNKQVVPEDEEQQLEDIREEQSNHHKDNN